MHYFRDWNWQGLLVRASLSSIGVMLSRLVSWLKLWHADLELYRPIQLQQHKTEDPQVRLFAQDFQLNYAGGI